MFDVLLVNGTVVDGTGSRRFRADVAVSGDRIAAVGHLQGASAARTIDATNLVVSPGFIDLHTHSDVTLLLNPRAESAVRQGVTTEIVGNCGHSVAPTLDGESAKSMMLGTRRVEVDWHTFGEYLDRLGRNGLAMNVGALVGHGALRLATMGFASRKATEAEIEQMKALLSQALREGAFGFSVGLEYAPGSNADLSELIELARVVASHERLFTSHMRNRDYRYVAAVQEMLDIVEATGVRIQLSHMTSKYGASPEAPVRVREMIEDAVESGYDVGADMLPYVWGMTSLPAGLLPPWAFEGGTSQLLARLRDDATRERLKQHDNPIWKIIRAGLWDRLVILSSLSHPEYVGVTVERMAADMGREPYDALFDLMLDEGEALYGICWAGRNVEEHELEEVLAHPLYAVASDGMTLAPYGNLADVAWHPTSFGWAARTLGVYARERGTLSLEKAVEKMTSLPAKRLGIGDRGTLKVGNYADIAVFDPRQVIDRSTLEKTKEYPRGVPYVLVNGKVVVERGEHTGALPGRVLRK